MKWGKNIEEFNSEDLNYSPLPEPSTLNPTTLSRVTEEKISGGVRESKSTH